LDNSRNSRGDGNAEPGQLLRFRQPGGNRAAFEAGSESRSLELSSADLFGFLWRGLADILGTAAAATLLRRAAQRTLSRCPDLAALAITRESLEYRYTLPAHWRDATPRAEGELSELARDLRPLLMALTGEVVVQRLAQIPELRACGIFPCEEGPS
jgi:hypothetical protein